MSLVGFRHPRLRGDDGTSGNGGTFKVLPNFYTSDDILEIVRVLHGAMDYDKLFD